MYVTRNLATNPNGNSYTPKNYSIRAQNSARQGYSRNKKSGEKEDLVVAATTGAGIKGGLGGQGGTIVRANGSIGY